MKLRALAVSAVLAASACGGDDGGASETTASTPSETTATTIAVTATTVDTATTAIAAPPSAAAWSRVPHEDSVFGGEEDQIMKSVTVGGPGLVAVGWDVGLRSAAVWTSPDGVTWSRVPHDEAVFGGQGDQFMLSVAAAGPGLVAVGSDARGLDRFAAVWTSPDGTTWSRVPHGAVFAGDEDWQQIEKVTVAGPGLVAVGQDGFDDPNAAVWTSPDGTGWSLVPHDEAVFGVEEKEEVMFSVTTGGPGLVAVGREGEGDLLAGDVDRNAAVWTSPDGITWSRVPHDEAVFGGEDWQQMTIVTAGGPGLVAIGESHSSGVLAVWTSGDGISWTRVQEEAGFGEGVLTIHAATTGGPGLVAVGYEFSGGPDGDRDAAVWTSTDGIIWSRVPHDEAILGGEDDQEILSVTVGGPGLVAVGTHGQIFPGDLDAAVWVAATED